MNQTVGGRVVVEADNETQAIQKGYDKLNEEGEDAFEEVCQREHQFCMTESYV